MALKFRERVFGGGSIEISVYNGDKIFAVVTHPPIKGAKWFVHFFGSFKKEKYPSKKKALDSLLAMTIEGSFERV